MEHLIETLNLEDFRLNPETKNRFVKQLADAFTSPGFFFLENHGIPENVIAKADRLFREFFVDLSTEQRLQYENKEKLHQVGYTPMKLETGEFSTTPDEKHFFQAGDRDEIPFVSEIPAFTPACMALFDEFRKVSLTLFQATALSLNLPEDYFDKKEGNSAMRAIHYPAHENPLADDGEINAGGNYAGMCASKHTDINMITLLLAREPGLELWHKNHWVPIIITNPNMLIVNAGDMLEHLTGGRYKSGLHRVVCEKNVERFSVPYFSHMNEQESIVPVPSLGESDLTKFHFKTAGEFLNYRLQQIGV